MSTDELYPIISKYIADCMTEDYRIATLHIEAFPGSAGCTGDYIDASGEKKNMGIHSTRDVLKPIMTFYKANVADPNFAKWNRAIAQLDSDSRFTMEFIWDQTLQDEIDSFN